ncbi:hypothetical protein NC651_032517 [Populus alba x Populus x berolinensis]|nr:hypothetical protein NC651_032517 [Populus alba x Populus x berolinensis]
MRTLKNKRASILQLVCVAAFFSLAVFVIQSSFFTGDNGSSDLNKYFKQEIRILSDFQSSVKQCVANRGFGLTASIVDHCKLILKFPQGTNSTWYNQQFKKFEPLEYNYDVCDAILLWEQYRNMTTVLTREYLDTRPDGWLDYAALRIAQLGAKNCSNRALCEDHLNVILPAKPPFHPRQFHTCAVVGNSGDLLKTEFGAEIDSHDAVIRDNEAPVNEKYAKHVGLKRDFRLVVRGAAANMVKILNGSTDEVLIIKSQTHRDFNTMIKLIPNPVYLFQGIVLRRGAKGTGMKTIELALSMCDIVDIYGFTVDPGYTEWTRYFSTPRKGHNPLQGRAYYQLLECLGVIRIHSPMRAQRTQDWSDVPSREMISRAHAAALRLKRGHVNQAADSEQFGSCKVWGNVDPDNSGPISGSSDMSDVRRNSNYSKWEVMPFGSLRKEAQDHYAQMGGISQSFIFILNISGISGILDYSASSSAKERFFTDLMVKCTLLCEDSSLREAALFIAPPVLPLKPCKNLFQLQTFTPSKAGASLAIKATTAIADTTTVDCSSVISQGLFLSVFPAEACEITGGGACLADMFPEVRLQVEEARNEAAQIASDNIEREYLVYNNAKTVFCAEACDDLGGEFCDTSCAHCAHQNVDDERKIDPLKYHRERSAIAFALISTAEGAPFLVVRNLRACTDRHAAINEISKTAGREITVRDSNRFHHLRDGFCSCRDYWNIDWELGSFISLSQGPLKQWYFSRKSGFFWRGNPLLECSHGKIFISINRIEHQNY